MKYFAACFVLSLLATPAMAELYQWKDENGRVHFSDQKPGDKKAAVTTLERAPEKSGKSSKATAPADTGSIEERQRRSLEALTAEREKREAEQRRIEEKAAKRAAECRQLRQHKSDIEGRALYRKGSENEPGGREYMPDSDRDAYDKKIDALIAERCE